MFRMTTIEERLDVGLQTPMSREGAYQLKPSTCWATASGNGWSAKQCDEPVPDGDSLGLCKVHKDEILP